MACVLGINAVFHDPAAAIVVDGTLVAAAEEERFSHRLNGKSPLPFATWELPGAAVDFCLSRAGRGMADVDAVAYSYDPQLAPPPAMNAPWDNGWESLRTVFARRAGRFLRARWPDAAGVPVRHVAHHVAHAASAWGPSPFDHAAVIVLDGRGEAGSYLAGHVAHGRLEVLAEQQLPHSLGRWYEGLVEHLGFRSSLDEDKVMTFAASGGLEFIDTVRNLVRTDGDGRFTVTPTCWTRLTTPADAEGGLDEHHAALAHAVQTRLEEVLLELAGWLHDRTGERALVMAGGVASNCAANSRLVAEGPFDEVWVPPTPGDAGTAIGAAVHVAAELGDRMAPMTSAALGPEWTDEEIETTLRRCAVPFERPDDLAAAVADALAEHRIVGWFQGRGEFGPRPLGHRGLLAHPGRTANLRRLDDITGPERFRPMTPVVPVDRAGELIVSGPVPSPYALFLHRISPDWIERLPAAVHPDGTARVRTVDAADEPLLHRTLHEFAARTGLPALVNASFRTAERPAASSPRDALECFGSAPIDVLAIGPCLIRRASVFA